MRDRPQRKTVFLIPSGHSVQPSWEPLVDIYRTGSGWLLKFDLAGVAPGDVAVRVAGCRVTVSGIRRDLLLEEGYYYHSLEISYNRFERTIQLPCDLSATDYSLEFRYGYLLVRIATDGEGNRHE